MDVTEPRWWTERFDTTSVSATFARLARERTQGTVQIIATERSETDAPDNVRPLLSKRMEHLRKFGVR